MNQKGVSLVELVLALFIIGSIVFLIINLPSSIALIGKSKRASLAKEIVNQKVENLRLQGFNNLPPNGTTGFSDVRLSSLDSGTGEIIIEDCPVEVCINGETDIKRVSVRVKWKERLENKQKSVEITTLIAKGGLE